MKNQALFSLKDESEKLKCCLLQFFFFFFDALRVKGKNLLLQEPYFSLRVEDLPLKERSAPIGANSSL